MTKYQAVIGAGYGDEGKGLITDYLAHKIVQEGDIPCVVRFNGGAQAGHTVVTPAGHRHVFSHFSSGSFVGATTFLSKFFVCNPILFSQERKEMQKTGVAPYTLVDSQCLVTTPYDMMLNQIIEESRGVDRHGSCGVGFNETIVRSATPGCAIRVWQLLKPKTLREEIDEIRYDYIENRLLELDLHLTPEWNNKRSDENIFNQFLKDCEEFISLIDIANPEDMFHYDNIIFEGAQGLLLDQNNTEDFPHLTRSNTGVMNILSLLEGKDVQIETFYTTRAYQTRHGAGPLSNELLKVPYSDVEEKTNVGNKYQGEFRYAYFDLDKFKATVTKDYFQSFKIVPAVALTCLDQLGADKNHNIQYYENNLLKICSLYYFKEKLESILEMRNLLTSFGPTRATIKTK